MLVPSDFVYLFINSSPILVKLRTICTQRDRGLTPSELYFSRSLYAKKGALFFHKFSKIHEEEINI